MDAAAESSKSSPAKRSPSKNNARFFNSKRRGITVATKLEIIKAVENGEKTTRLSKRLKIKQATIFAILRNKDNIKKASEQGLISKTRIKRSFHTNSQNSAKNDKKVDIASGIIKKKVRTFIPDNVKREICKLVSKGSTQSEVSKLFGIKPCTVSCIVRAKMKIMNDSKEPEKETKEPNVSIFIIFVYY